MPDDGADVRPPAGAERLLTAAEAAAVLGVSERTVRRRIAAGKLPAIDAGGQMRVPASAVGVRAPDASAGQGAGQRRTLPAIPSVSDAALVALVERQGREIAELTGRLAVAEERLRALGAGQDARRAPPQPPGAAEGPAPAEDARPRWRRWLGLGLG